MNYKQTNMLADLVKPAALKRGDRIATVSPSWGGPGTYKYRYEAGKKQLENNFGVEVIEMPNTCKSAEWIYNNPKARADDLMRAFSDPNINAIFSTIGGDDSIRLLPYLDFNIVRDNPKIFMGYSDTTIMHFACIKAGLSSFYGPSIMSGFAENCGLHPYTESSVKKTLFDNSSIGLIHPSKEWTDERLDWSNPENQKIKRSLHKSSGWKLLQGEGIVEGRLIGGCFEVIETIKATELWPSLEIWEDAILFLEISEERPPEVIFKRGLRNYGAQGILQRLKGILFGRPGGSLPLSEIEKYDAILKDVVCTEFGLSNIPVVSQMDFGHCDPKFVIPYGVRAKINCENVTLEILESGVI